MFGIKRGWYLSGNCESCLQKDCRHITSSAHDNGTVAVQGPYQLEEDICKCDRVVRDTGVMVQMERG